MATGTTVAYRSGDDLTEIIDTGVQYDKSKMASEGHQKEVEEFRPVQMPVVPGYEFVNPVLSDALEDGAIRLAQPPSYEQAVRVSAVAPNLSQMNRVHVDETTARAALLEEVQTRCCYGDGTARELEFSNISTSYALHLTLNTFTEKREIYWTKTPYHAGQPVDGPSNGPAPGPWDLVCHPSQMFKDQVTCLEVPHTSYVLACPQCAGTCRIPCERCRGDGRTRCTSCGGVGYRSRQTNGQTVRDNCVMCSGRGHRVCTTCQAVGYLVCPCCKGCGHIRYYIELKVTYKDYLSEKVLEFGGKPSPKKLAKAQGYEQCRQEGARVMPLEGHPVAEIVQYSRDLLNDATNDYQSIRILMQRQVLRSIPVSECRYTWKKKEGVFWVYGTENRVELLDYPQTCCCCTII